MSLFSLASRAGDPAGQMRWQNANRKETQFGATDQEWQVVCAFNSVRRAILRAADDRAAGFATGQPGHC